MFHPFFVHVETRVQTGKLVLGVAGEGATATHCRVRERVQDRAKAVQIVGLQRCIC